MTTTSLGAFVDSNFTKGYILDEERIRKLNEILLTRGAQIHPDCKPTFKIYKADTFSYTTDDLQKILTENNADWEKIERFTIFMKQDDDFFLSLDFAPEITNLHIEGKDRDLVFLIFSELKQYIGNEIAVIKPIFGRKDKFVLMIIPLIAYLLLMAIYLFSSDLSKSATTAVTKVDALNTQDYQIKLNFLIERQSDLSSERGFPLALIGLSIFSIIPMFAGDFILRPLRYLYPNHLFLIGKEIEKNSKRITLRHNLLWGVIIGSIVGICTGLLVWLITAR